ncbi:MAG: hypothetical protein WCQ77_13730 [Planctomycetota bacterium]
MRSVGRCGHVLLALCILSAGASTSLAEEARAALPKASVHFDDQTMRLAYAASNDVMTLMEFIPDGQTLDEWTSLAAVYVYNNAAIGPQKRADALAAQIRKSNPQSPIASQDSPDSRQRVISFPLWSPGEPFVEFSVFAFGTDASGTDVGLQYAIRKTTTPEAFLQRDLEPLRERLVKMLLRDGLHIANESDLTLVRLALCPSDKAICDTILKSDADGLKAVLQQPDERSALVLLVAAAIAFNSEQLEDSAFLFYAGQLRLRFDEQCFPPKLMNEQNPIHLMRGYAAELGSKINPAVMHEPPLFSRALARVARWRPRTPSGYQPGYEFDQRLTEEAARAAAEPNRVEFLSRMGDMTTLLNDEEYFSATQVVKNLCAASEDRLPTKDEYEAALKTLVRIEKEKGVDLFHAFFQERAPPNESAR